MKLKGTRQAWLVVSVTILACIVAAINSFKVPPLLPALMADLQVSMVTGGWLMSVSSVAGLILAVPSAFLLSRLGSKRTGLVALACTITGDLLGALAPNAGVLLAGRVIEGISMGLLVILTPSLISMWFRPRDRGLPMGIYASFVPIGSVIAFNTAHPLQGLLGWRAVWWAGLALAVVAFVLYGLVVDEPPETSASQPPPLRSLAVVLRNRTTWLLGATFGALAFSTIAYNTWSPVYLTTTLHIEPALANRYASLMFLAAIPSNIIAGWLLSRMKNRYILLPLSMAVTSVLFLGSFSLGDVGLVAPYMLLLGLLSNAVPASVFTLAPETVARIELAGMAQAVVSIGSGTGALLGPPVLGAVISRGWSVASILLVVVVAAGTLTALLVARRLTVARQGPVPSTG